MEERDGPGRVALSRALPELLAGLCVPCTGVGADGGPVPPATPADLEI